MHYFWHVKNMYFKNVKTLFFLKQVWSYVLFSFCTWFYVFAPGSHCFAIDVLNRSAICTVHFRSIWTAPLRFSTCRSWAGSKVIAAKLDPKKSNLKKQNQSSSSPTGFSIFFTFFTFFHIFPQVHFQNAFFSHFFRPHFQNAFFHMFFTLLWTKVKNAKKCVLKMRLEQHVKNAFWKCAKQWIQFEPSEQKAVEKFLFLSSIFPFFCRYRCFSGFLWNPMLNYWILNLNIGIPHKHIFIFHDSCQ